MEYVSSGNIALTELIELVVKQKHGEDAIAEPTIHDVGKGKKRRIEVERTGKRIPYTVDIERWGSAREAIRSAVEVGELTAYAKDANGLEQRLMKDDWNEKTTWRTLITGKYEYENKPELYGQLVYFRERETNDFLGDSCGSVVSESTQKHLSNIGSKGGQHSNICVGILEAIKQVLTGNNNLSAEQIWLKLANYGSGDPMELDDYEIYIDGELLWQKNSNTGDERRIKKASFNRYVSTAKTHPAA